MKPVTRSSPTSCTPLSNASSYETPNRTGDLIHCEHCQKPFSDTRSLKEHQKIHSSFVKVKKENYSDSSTDSPEGKTRRSSRRKIDLSTISVKTEEDESTPVPERKPATVTSQPQSSDPKSKPSFHCTFGTCPRQFTSKNGLKLHMKKHSANNTLYSCPSCHEIFASDGDLKKHSKVHNGDNSQLLCPHCSEKFTKKNASRLHVRSCEQNPLRDITCFKCNGKKKFGGEEKLLSHLKTFHKIEGRYLCHLCSDVFDQQVSLSEHKKTCK